VEIKFYDDKKILYIDINNLPEWLTINSLKIVNSKENIEQKSKPKKIKNQTEKEINNSSYSIDDIISIG
jgi:hypothetical protein